MLQARTGRHRASPSFVVVVKKTKASGHRKTRGLAPDAESGRKRWSAAFDDVPPKPLPQPQPVPAESQIVQEDPVSVRQIPNRVLPSLLSEEAEQARIAHEIEAYKARWRTPKPPAGHAEGQPRVRKARRQAPPIPADTQPETSAVAAELPPAVPSERKARGRRPTAVKVSPRRLREMSVGHFRRGERWKRRLPRACW